MRGSDRNEGRPISSKFGMEESKKGEYYEVEDLGFEQDFLNNDHIDEVDDEQNDTVYEPADLGVFAQGIMESKAVTSDVAR